MIKAQSSQLQYMDEPILVYRIARFMPSLLNYNYVTNLKA